MKKVLIVLLVLFFRLSSFSQNLVPNHSFENKTNCPNSPWGNLNDVALWNNPSLALPGYYNSCDFNNVAGIPSNVHGNQNAKDGNAYTRIFTYLDGGWNTFESRDYLQIQLNQKLIAGQKYYWCMAVSLCDNSEFATNNIGISLSDTMVNQQTSQNLNLVVYDNVEDIIDDKQDWVEIFGEFIAIGGEEYLIIGNMFSQSNTKKKQLVSQLPGGDGGYGSYYYIDNVYLGESPKCFEEDVEIPNLFTPNGDGLNDIFFLDFPFEEVVVYNRWGEKVFVTTKNGAHWDGRTNASAEVPCGTYYYVIKTEDEIYKGYLTLLR